MSLGPPETGVERATRPRWLLRGALLSCVVACAGLLAGSTASEPRPTTTGTPTATPAARFVGGPDDVADPVVRARAVQALLDRRGEAVLRGASATFLETCDPASRRRAPVGGVVGDPARTFAASALPLASLGYRVTGLEPVDLPSEPGVPAVRVRADLLWRLAAFDRAPASTPQALTLVHRDGSWRVAAEVPAGTRPAPWQVGRIRVTHGRSTLVIGVGGPARPTPATLRAYAALGDRTVAAVTDLAVEGWTRRLVIVVPDSSQRAATLLGRPDDGLSRIAAVATADAENGREGADRVWLNTPVLTGLSPLARGIVLRHEGAHVALAAPSTGTTPMWLEEGYAEWAGYRGSGVPLRVATGDALAAVRRGEAANRLPGDADFGGDTQTLSLAYQRSHLAVSMIAARYGPSALSAVYRSTAAGRGGAEDNVDAALRSVLSLSRAELLAGLADYTETLAGSDAG